VTAVNLTSATEAGALMESSLHGPGQMWLDPAQMWVGHSPSLYASALTACSAMTVNAFLAALRTLSASHFACRLTHHPCWFLSLANVALCVVGCFTPVRPHSSGCADESHLAHQDAHAAADISARHGIDSSQVWPTPCRICSGTGLAPCHICTGTGLAASHPCALQNQ
jgi:hypothetical protein